MTNEPIDALLKTGGTPGGEAEEDDDDQNLMEEEAREHHFYRNDDKDVESDRQVDKSLHIKGQMNFMPDWNVVMFLGSPAIANLEQLQVLTNQNLHLILIVIISLISTFSLLGCSSATSPCTTSQETCSSPPASSQTD